MINMTSIGGAAVENHRVAIDVTLDEDLSQEQFAWTTISEAGGSGCKNRKK